MSSRFEPDEPTILINGTVRTLATDGVGQEAIGIAGDRIVAVGSQEAVRAACPDGKLVDLAGATVLPSFTDSHTHFKRASAFLALYLDFEILEAKSIADIRDAVATRTAVEPSGTWIQGDSLNPSLLDERRFPTRHELDEVSPAHPVVLRSVGRHVVVANSLALNRAGIDASTPDPLGGRIEHDDEGGLTGVLHEEAKLRLDANRLDTVIPPDSVKDRVTALSRGIELLNRNGITAIHEMPRDPDQVSDWLRLYETEQPRVRVRFYIRGLAAQTSFRDVLGAGLRSGFGNEWLTLGGVKFSIDGSGVYRNAMVYDPYPGQPENRGLQRLDGDEFVEAVQLTHDGGLQIAVHAIGQRAVDMALDAFAALGEPGPQLAARRHRLEHAYFPARPGQLERIRDLGLVLSIQPSAIEYSGDAWRKVFEDDVLTGVIPIADAVRLGIPVQINSDFPCTRLDPFVGIQAAVMRTTRTGHVLDETQAIDVAQALWMMTYQPAHTAFEESWRGRLAPGLAADLIVVDRDPLEVSPEDLDDLLVLKTIAGGRLVYEA